MHFSSQVSHLGRNWVYLDQVVYIFRCWKVFLPAIKNGGKTALIRYEGLLIHAHIPIVIYFFLWVINLSALQVNGCSSEKHFGQE